LPINFRHPIPSPCSPQVLVSFIISMIYLLIRTQKYDRNINDENRKLRKGAGNN
jgi:hypothetical protein